MGVNGTPLASSLMTSTIPVAGVLVCTADLLCREGLPCRAPSWRATLQPAPSRWRASTYVRLVCCAEVGVRGSLLASNFTTSAITVAGVRGLCRVGAPRWPVLEATIASAHQVRSL